MLRMKSGVDRGRSGMNALLRALAAAAMLWGPRCTNTTGVNPQSADIERWPGDGARQETAPPAGTIAGAVVDSAGNGVPDLPVILRGPGPYRAVSGAGGHYVIDSVPVGQHELQIASSCCHDVTVQDKETTTVADFTVVPVSGREAIEVGSLRLMDDDGERVETGLEYYNADEPHEVTESFVKPGCRVYLECEVALTAPVRQDRTPVYRSVEVFHNGQPIYGDIPERGLVVTGELLPAGVDTFEIVVDGILCHRHCLLDTAKLCLVVASYVHITTGPTRIIFADYMAASDDHVTIGSRTYAIQYADTERIDWDVYLVNDRSGDTCSWATPTPEWGRAGLEHDNPLFSGDSAVDTAGWRPDHIRAADLAPGEYSVLVRYVQGLVDSAALPQLNIAVGRSRRFPIVCKYYQISAPSPLARGDLWDAGQIMLPQRTFVPHQ